jgi:hypothetical protein
MKKDFCEIVCIIDRSGSMASVQDDMIGGFNTFIDEQKKLPGEVSVTYAQFDHEYEIIHESIPINKLPLLTSETYSPRGLTALLDAVGKTLEDVGERLHNTPEANRPEKVVVIIMTDGMENASKRFLQKSEIKKMIEHQQKKYSWEFIYLGANQDAFAEGASFGVPIVNTQVFSVDSSGVNGAYNTISAYVSQYRSK